ncbi:zinc transporter ZitB [Enterobacter hormaechei subsp. xiangfangensis]|nr:zinc transporter ZitB [Enterobacter hormaechei subsp. xiangfangensis]
MMVIAIAGLVANILAFWILPRGPDHYGPGWTPIARLLDRAWLAGRLLKVLAGGRTADALHVQVIPPHDHDALLERIRHFLEHHYEIAHSTIQMEYQPCSGPAPS